MAAPRHRLGAHQRTPFGLSQADGARQGRFKFGRLHVIGITAKTGIPPCGVPGVARRMAQASQRAEPNVSDFGGAQLCGKILAVELRISPRARNSTYIDYAFDTMRAEQLQKLR